MMKDELNGYVHDAYRMLHSIPETAMEEYKTAAYLAKEIRSFGYKVTENVGGTGIIAILDSGKPGLTVGLRADMDALTYDIDGILECRHTCGHDANSAMVLAAARMVAERGINKGKCVVLFQPGEEPILGALAMIESGMLDNLGLNEIYGIHLNAGLRNGEITPALCHSASGRMKITFFGKSTDVSTSDHGVNAVEVAAMAVHGINAIHMDPMIPHSIKTTHLTVKELEPEGVQDWIEMIVDLKHQDTPSYAKMQDKAKKVVTEIAKAIGASVTVQPINYVPGAQLSEEAIEVARQAIIEELGEEWCADPTYATGGDDFHYFAPHLGCRSTYLGVGADVYPSLHHQDMQFDPAALDRGARVLANIVCRQLTL
ncbi:MAG: amidohydrolase [Tepidanaerobacteraceae bacterium]